MRVYRARESNLWGTWRKTRETRITRRKIITLSLGRGCFWFCRISFDESVATAHARARDPRRVSSSLVSHTRAAASGYLITGADQSRAWLLFMRGVADFFHVWWNLSEFHVCWISEDEAYWIEGRNYDCVRDGFIITRDNRLKNVVFQMNALQD